METTSATTKTGQINVTVDSSYYGEFVADFDTDAIDAEVLTLINAAIPEGITVLANGDVIACLDLVDVSYDIDWEAVWEDIDVEEIAGRHQRKGVATATVTHINEELIINGEVAYLDTIEVVGRDGETLDHVTVEPSEDSEPYDAALVEAGWTILGFSDETWTVSP